MARREKSLATDYSRFNRRNLSKAFNMKAYASKTRYGVHLGAKSINSGLAANSKTNMDTKAKKERFDRYIKRHQSHVVKTEKGLVST